MPCRPVPRGNGTPLPDRGRRQPGQYKQRARAAGERQDRDNEIAGHTPGGEERWDING
jgi:hypothetical protein